MSNIVLMIAKTYNSEAEPGGRAAVYEKKGG